MLENNNLLLRHSQCYFWIIGFYYDSQLVFTITIFNAYKKVGVTSPGKKPDRNVNPRNQFTFENYCFFTGINQFHLFQLERKF